MKKTKYKALELFAGAGGLALGLEQAGFNHSALIEIDKFAAQTLKNNRPNWNIINEDIINIVEKGLKKYINVDDIDLISGGFPCQPFSYAGNKLGLEDTRGTLFYYFGEIIKEVKPKMFLAENVKGLLTHDKGKTFKVMLNIFEGLGYKLYWKILNAVDYDVAQKRQRLILIGIRNDLWKKDFIFPYKSNKILTLKNILKNVPESIGIKYSEKKKMVLDLVRPGGCWRDLPLEVAKSYMGKSYFLSGGKTGIARRLSWEEPSLTLTCSPVQMQTERCHPDETRPFTTREYARIQSFPDDWKFTGSAHNIYKQIGNAVPVNLAKKVGLQIINYLEEMEIEKMNNYPLSFISEKDLEAHVKDTILKYSESLKGISLWKFRSNIVDPIKMLFDSSVFNKSLESIIESEVIRQKDKSNNNIIGYFHQNIFKYINSEDWSIPKQGFDIVNLKKKIFVEMKNKHNTMNSSSSQKTYINMQNTIVNDNKSTCLLVEVIAKKSQNIPWTISIDNKKMSSENVRRVSIDRFYEIVTGDKLAFYNLCNYLPTVINKILSTIDEFKQITSDTVIQDLKMISSTNLLDSLFKLSFSSYYGWNNKDDIEL